MGKFTTRVKLHGASTGDYEALHRYMAEQKFQRHVTSDQGIKFQLPTAEYYSHGDLSAEDVRRIASFAAAKTGKSHWILVTEWEKAAWTLKQV